MEKWNDVHYFTRGQKIYFLICGIIIALCVGYVNHIFWEYRVVNQEWNETFVSPETFWLIERE